MVLFIFVLSSCGRGSGAEPDSDPEADTAVSADGGASLSLVACDLLSTAEIEEAMGASVTIPDGTDFADETFTSCSWRTEDGAQSILLNIWTFDSDVGASLQFDAMAGASEIVEDVDNLGDEALIMPDGSNLMVLWRQGEQIFATLNFLGIGTEASAVDVARLVNGRINP